MYSAGCGWKRISKSLNSAVLFRFYAANKKLTATSEELNVIISPLSETQ